VTGGPGQLLLAHLLPEAPTEEAKSVGVLRSRVELRKVVPEPGSYLNETSYFERD
jgi:hypothetical protein